MSRPAPARQEVLGAVSDSLLTLLGSTEGSALERALAQLGDALGLRAAFVAEHRAPRDGGGPTASVLYQWCDGTGVDTAAAAQRIADHLGSAQNASGHPWCVDLAATDAGHPEGRDNGAGSMLGVPIMGGPICWGQLGLVSDGDAEIWNDGLVSAMSAVAAAIGATLERQRAFEAIRTQAERIRSLHHITSQSLSNVSDRIADALSLAAGSLDHELAVVVRIRPESPDACTVEYADSGRGRSLIGQSFPVPGDFFGEHAHQRASIFRAESADEGLPKTHGVHAYLSTPVWSEAQPYGAVAFVSTKPMTRPYSSSDREFAQIVSNWIGSVLDQVAADARRRGLEQRLEHTRRLESLGVAVGGIAHDFNNLLMITSTGLGLAEDALAAGDVELVPHLVKNARRATIRATELTSKLMTFSGRPDLVFGPTILADTIGAHAERVGRSLGAEVQVTIDPSTTGHPVMIDAGAVQEAVANLVTNAHEASREGSAIRVRFGRTVYERPPSADFVAPKAPAGLYEFIEVEDAGGGIPEQHLRRVFEPFYTTKFTGRGLGLSETVGVMRSHRGLIDIDSEPGRGTRIRLSFPHQAAEEPALPMESAPPLSGSRAADEHFLLVEDEDLLRETLKQALNLRGISVDLATNGREALERLAATVTPYTAIVLDVTMPVMDGRATLLALRDTHPEIPVILVSGYSEENVGAVLRPGEPTAFLQKPFDTSVLLAALQGLRRQAAIASDHQ